MISMSKKIETLTDAALVRMMCGTETDRNTALHYIFVESGWRQEALVILQNKCIQLPDAKDALQQALIILDQKVRQGDYRQAESMKNYFIGICKKRVFVAQRSVQRVDFEAEFPNTADLQTPEIDFLNNEKKDLVRQILNQLDEKCRELLKLYMLSFSMKEIRAELNIVSDEMTRKKAYECRKKFANLFDNYPTIKQYFNDKT
jgi:RNA polymerase sigma factor (sigma-70 family)